MSVKKVEKDEKGKRIEMEKNEREKEEKEKKIPQINSSSEKCDFFAGSKSVSSHSQIQQYLCISFTITL